MGLPEANRGHENRGGDSVAERTVLIVDPNPAFLETLRAIAQAAGVDVVTETDFDAARQRIASKCPDMLVVNIRLGRYNGIHLVHLARLTNPSVSAIVYGGADDLPLAVDAQHAGAFYELESAIAVCLPAYLTMSLPPHDRRSVRPLDAPRPAAAGRRASDRIPPHPLPESSA
jgi:CheY-like chemotaxis protein